MSKVETLVSQYKNELKYAGPFYISHEGFGAAPLGQIDYPALSMAFAEWLDARGILPEIVGWSNKTGFCDADAAGYAAAFPANENGLAAALSGLESKCRTRDENRSYSDRSSLLDVFKLTIADKQSDI